MKMKTLGWMLALAALLAALMALQPAQAHPAPLSANCSSASTCMIEAPAPVDMRVRAGCGGPVTFFRYDDTLLDQTGAGSCFTASFWVVNSGGNIYSGSLTSQTTMYRDPGGKYMEQHMQFTQNGEDIHLKVNYTLVTNGTLIHYHVANHGNEPWDFGWKYSWDIQLGSDMDPMIYVPNRPGDGEGPTGTYDDKEADLGLTTDVPYVKVWQTRTGPDGPGDLKQYFWWDPGFGGVPPDMIQFMQSGRAAGSSGSWMYQITDMPIGSDSELQTYHGYPQLIHLEPDDGKPGGPDEKEYIMWFTTGVPDPLITWGVDGGFRDRPVGQESSRTFIEAGQTAVFPLWVESRTSIAGTEGKQHSIAQRIGLRSQLLDVPDAWEVKLTDALTGKEVQELTLNTGERRDLQLRITAPPGAYGNDLARVNVFAEILDKPTGIYNKKDSVFSKGLFTTTIIKPDYGIKVEGPSGEPPVVDPGTSLTFPVKVTNLGNLRDPFLIQMDVPTGRDPSWGLRLDPLDFLLGRGETRHVDITFDIPADAFGGERTAVARASVPSQNQFNTTLLKFRIASDAFIEVLVEKDEIVLPRGGTASFDGTVTNRGFEPEAIDLWAVADQLQGLEPGAGTVPSQWEVEVFADGFSEPLQPGETRPVSVTVTAPLDAMAGEQKNILLFATKQGQTDKIDEELVRAVVSRDTSLIAAAEPATRAGDPATVLQYLMTVTNNGNSVENLTVEATRLPAGWQAKPVPERFELGVGESRPVAVAIQLPADARAGVHDVRILVRNADQLRSAAVDLKGVVNQVFSATLDTETPTVRILPKDTVNLTFELVNTGNGPDRFSLTGIPADWDVSLVPDVSVVLEPGQKQLFRLTGTVRGEVGTYRTQLQPLSLTLQDVPGEAALGLTVYVSRPDLVVSSIQVISPAKHVGDLEVVQAVVQNLGNIEAKDVVVALYVDGLPSGTEQRFERLAPERSLVASLPWAKTAGEHAYKVVVDPYQTIDEGEGEENNEAVLKAPTALRKEVPLLGPQGRVAHEAAPGGGAVAGLLVAAALAVTFRRRLA